MMVLRVLFRIRRLLLCLVLLAALAVAYFIFEVHTEATAGIKLPVGRKVVFESNGQHHVRLVPANPRNLEDPENDVSYNKDEDEDDPSEGKHYELFRQFSAGFRRLDGIQNMTKRFRPNTAQRLHRPKEIRVPDPPNANALPKNNGVDVNEVKDTSALDAKIRSKVKQDIVLTGRKEKLPTTEGAKASAIKLKHGLKKGTETASTTRKPTHDPKVAAVNPYMMKIKLEQESLLWTTTIKPALDPNGKVADVSHLKVNADVIKSEEVSPAKPWRNDASSSMLDRQKELQRTTTKMPDLDSKVADVKVKVSVVKRKQETSLKVRQWRNDASIAKFDQETQLQPTSTKTPDVGPMFTEVNPYMLKIKTGVIKPQPLLPTKMRPWRQTSPRPSLGQQREPRGRQIAWGNQERSLIIPRNQENRLQNNGRGADFKSHSGFGEVQRKDAKNGAINMAILPTARPKTCNKCFQPHITHVINPKHLCKHADYSILVLVMVFTEHDHQEKRNVIRETWGSVVNKNVGVVRLVFVLGDIEDENQKAQTRQEAAKYADILMGDFKESFRNLTLKSVMSLGWATEYCAQAKYLMKTDDDMWVNIPMFLSIVSQFQLEKAIGGTCWEKPWQPHRQEDKYYVTELEYPGYFYPPLCVGTAYVMTLQTASDIYRVHPNIPFFHLEDVYVALCREYLGYTVVPMPGFFNKKEPFSICYYRTKLVTSHWVNEAEMREAWTKECFLEARDPISDFLARYPALSPTHPRHRL
jgi:hypothetical protein